MSVCLYHSRLDQARQAGFLIKFMGPLARKRGAEDVVA